MSRLSSAVAPQVLDAAAEWLMRLHEEGNKDQTRAELAAWCRAHPDHARAWQHAETLLADLQQIPGDLGRNALARRQQRVSRRQLVSQLALLLAAGPLAWSAARVMPWQSWSADYRTATGEQRQLSLQDGTRIALNTASAVNVRLTSGETELTLVRGEMLVTVAAGQPPLLLKTPDGLIRAGASHFLVREHAQASRVAVFDGSVVLHPSALPGSGLVLNAGWQTWLRAQQAGPLQEVTSDLASWSQGVLIADRMRLADVVAELGRYRTGMLRCHPAIADLPISGALPVMDTDRGLALLAASFPITVRRVTDYWVSIEPVA